MVSGFFLGGMAPGILAGANSVSNDMKLQSLLKLQVAQHESNQKHADFLKLRADAISHLDDTMTQLKIAHPELSPMQLASNPAVVSLRDMIGGFDKNLKLPSTIDSTVAAIAERPSQAVTEGALARAKEGPQHQALVQSEINKNNALSGIDLNNPDRPGTGANGPALGQKPQASTFNQRFAQTAQTEAPKVLDWGTARSVVSEKYSPEIATKAELWLKGNASIVSGLRGSGAGRNNERKQIQDAAMDLARLTGTTADQINKNFTDFAGKRAAATAEGRVAGAAEGRLGTIINAIENAIPAAVKASNDVPRSNVVLLNKAQQLGLEAISDPKLKIFQQKNLQVAEFWAKSFNPNGVMRNEDRDLALGILNTAVGNGTYEAAANAIRDSIGLERSAAIKYITDRFGGGESDESSGSEPGPGGVKVHGFTFTPTGQ